MCPGVCVPVSADVPAGHTLCQSACVAVPLGSPVSMQNEGGGTISFPTLPSLMRVKKNSKIIALRPLPCPPIATLPQLVIDFGLQELGGWRLPEKEGESRISRREAETQGQSGGGGRGFALWEGVCVCECVWELCVCDSVREWQSVSVGLSECRYECMSV